MANVPDTKKCADFVNIIATTMLAMRAEYAALTALRATFVSVNPSVTGTPLQGKVSALNTAYTALGTAVNDTAWDSIIAAYVPSHLNNSLS